MAESVKVFSLIDDTDQEALRENIKRSYTDAGSSARYLRTAVQPKSLEDEQDTGGLEQGQKLVLAPFEELIGIEPSVYRQIEAAINAGKQHLMFYGPPGTGKTTLARRLAGILNGRNWTLITGSADWSSQDIIGGYQPLEGGSIQFFPGALLRNFDKPLVIDELNRCDIDKVIGPLFTVLSGQATTLPYRLDASDAESAQYTVLPQFKSDPAPHEFSPGPQWRIIATINSMDKSSLYQMSFALSRRFGWIYVDAPFDKKSFLEEYVERILGEEIVSTSGTPPLAAIWDAIGKIRPFGPAPIMDAAKTLRVMSPGCDLLGPPDGELRNAYFDVFELYMLPLLDGILKADAEAIATSVTKALGVENDASEAERLKRRILSIAL